MPRKDTSQLTEQIVIRYLDAWNKTDPHQRRAAIDALTTEDCGYADPLAVVRGRDALDGFIAGIQKQFPGFVLKDPAPTGRRAMITSHVIVPPPPGG